MKTSLVLLLLCACLPSQAETGFLDRSIQIKGETFRYQIYVPMDYTPDKKWPLMVYLHGTPRIGDDGLSQTATGLADAIRQKRSRFPLIAVFPQARTGTRWWYPDMVQQTLGALDKTTAELNVDPNRVYLGGYSLGAVGTYRIASHFPDRFAAIVSIAGLVESGSDLPLAEKELDHKTNPYTATPDPYAELAKILSALPVYIAHGDRDETIPVDQSRRLDAAMKKIGAPVHYVEYAGSDHTQVHSKSWADPGLIDWLLKQHK
jgi:predicted peptidase